MPSIQVAFYCKEKEYGVFIENKDEIKQKLREGFKCLMEEMKEQKAESDEIDKIVD